MSSVKTIDHVGPQQSIAPDWQPTYGMSINEATLLSAGRGAGVRAALIVLLFVIVAATGVATWQFLGK